MAEAARKLLILADDHPHVRSALERLVRDLREHITLYSAEHPQDLQPLASKRIADAQLLSFADITLDPGHIAPEVPLEPPAQADGPDAPLMVVSAREQGITTSWIVAMSGSDGAARERVRFEEAINQRAVALDLIRSLKPGDGAASADTAAEPSMDALLRTGLTQRQAEVLLCLADGLANKEIARKLAISEWTVRHHVSAILERLEVNNRGRAAQLARQLGYA